MDSGAENGIHVTSKYEDLVRQQMLHKETLDTSLEHEVNMTLKSELSNSLNGSVRHTPIGDVATEQYVDNEDTVLSNHSNHGSVHGSSHGSARQTPQWDATDGGKPSIVDEMDVASNRSHHSSARQTPQSNVVEDILRNSYSKPSSRPGSEHSDSYHGSNRHTPIVGDVLSGEVYQSGGRSGSQSLEGSLRQTPVDVNSRPPSNTVSLHGSSHTPVTEAVDDILERYSRGSNRSRTESIEDVLERPSRSAHSSVRHTPQRDLLKEDLSLPGSQRQTPQNEAILESFRSSQERLYGSQEIRGSTEVSARPGSAGGSQHSGSSRPHSVTSEQELSQYLDYQRGDLGPRRAASLTGLHQSDPLLPPILQDRPGSTSSMPPLSTQIMDRHLSTPDNHIRHPAGGSSPHIRSPLVTTRSGSVSRASSRTVTPASVTGAVTENGFREDSKKVDDYEDTIMNVQKVLSSREKEVHQLTEQVQDLKDINRSLMEELEHTKGNLEQSSTSREYEKKYNQLLSEKEILAAEVVKLQDQLTLMGAKGNSVGIDNYSPNNPLALQRKIDDLEGHIQDMQEANETAMLQLTKSEKRVKELLQENKSLKQNPVQSFHDLEQDNLRLQKISRLGDGEGDYRSRIELQQLKDDLRALRDRNYQLNEENIRLKEGSDVARGMRPGELSYNHDIKISRETTLRADDHLRRPSSRTPEKVPLTRDNVSSLERSFGSDKESRDYKYTRSGRIDGTYLDNYKTGRGLSAGLERSRSEQDIETRPNRPLPDGQVAEKLVTDTGKYSRHYERTRLEREQLSRDIYSSDRSKERDRREHSHLENQRPFGGSQLDSRGWREGGHKRTGYFSDVRDSAVHAGKSRDYETQHRKQQSSHENFYSHERSYKGAYDTQRKLYPEENGELSDTATDILLSSDFTDRKPSRSHRRRRRQSVESESMSSASEDEHHGSRRRRSKSVDARGDWVARRTPTGSPSRTTPAVQMRISASSERLSQNAPAQNSAGFRSVTPQPIATQHNKGMMGNIVSLSSSLTQGMRPFAPLSPGDMKLDDVVKFSRQGGKLSQGTVKFIGHLPGRSDVYLGVELDKEEGKHDGTFEAIRYFKCKPNKGVFVAFNKIVMAWAP
ncbi:myosin heavy chain, striated muscle-like isoform X5 [Haliotis asinina]